MHYKQIAASHPPVWRRTLLALTVALLLAALRTTQGDEWTLRVVGDLSFGGDWSPVFDAEGSAYPFRQISAFLSAATLTVGFLDGPLSERGEPAPWARPPMRSSPVVAESLKLAGFDGVCLASPRAMDFGAEAFLDTQASLETAGIVSFGAGLNDTLSRMYGLLTVGDIRVACLGFLHGVQAAHASQEEPGANPALASTIREDVANAKENADVVLVFIHWGDASGDAVDGKQRLIAQLAVDAGATAVFGLRRETLLGAEVLSGKPVCYSLGDFIRGVGSKRHGRVSVPTVVFEDVTPVRVEWTAVRIDVARKPGDDPATQRQPRLLTGKDARNTLDDFRRRCEPFGTRFEASDGVLVMPLMESFR
jgi:poly-gamma-glutamate synthesis protein (capsule biosynthesis protein)